MKLFKEKKTRYRNLILILLPFLLLGGFFGYTAYKSYKALTTGDDEIEASPKYSLPEYGYQLRANCTQLQFDIFQELIEAITAEEVDEAKVAECIAKNYVTDFYTWSNKNGMYDIGGMNYVYSPGLANIYVNARDTYYHYLNYYLDEYGQDKLPEVSSVEVLNVTKGDPMEIDGTSYPVWFVKVHIEFAEKEGGYDTSGIWKDHDIYVIKNEGTGRYEIAQAYEGY